MPLLRIEETLPLDLPTRAERLIARLQDEAAGDGERALAARRVLGLAAAHTGFYIPRDLLPRGEYRRVEIALELAVQVREDNAAAWYNLACARARLGRRAEALDSLERAIAAGYRDAGHMAADPDLESLRGEERFAALLARARETGG
jgi:tetratricopeptide (TPR) repeat protein